MRKRYLLISIIACIIIILSTIIVIISCIKPNIGENTLYFCDVKVFSIKTNISIKKSNETIANICGPSIKFITNPLAMFDNNGKIIAYGADEYHFISQDSHTIFVDNQFTIEMVGKFSFWGNEYDIYDSNGQLIAKASFNMINSYGTIVSTDGILWADYYSNVFRLDYVVRIKDECLIDDTSILMMMASFYSDKSADSSSNSNTNN